MRCRPGRSHVVQGHAGGGSKRGEFRQHVESITACLASGVSVSDAVDIDLALVLPEIAAPWSWNEAGQQTGATAGWPAP